MRNARPSTAWLGDGVYCLHAEKSRYSVSFCELGQTKPNQHAAGHRHTGSNAGPGMLSNGSISHYTKCWRHFIEHMFFSVPVHLWLVYCHLELAAPTVGNLSLNASVSALLRFTSHTGRFGHNALPSLRLWSAGLRGHKGWGGVWAVDLQKGPTKP